MGKAQIKDEELLAAIWNIGLTNYQDKLAGVLISIHTQQAVSTR